MSQESEGERRKSVDSQFAAFSTRIGSLEAAMRDHNLMGAGIKDEVAALQTEMKVNTQVTTEVRDILVTFKTVGKIAKWCSYLLGALAAGLAALKGLRA